MKKSHEAEACGRIALAILSFFVGLPPDVWAGPEGAQVLHGQVQFQQQGAQTTIQASDRAIIQYSGFDIGAHETVQFVQPSAWAWVLNRIQSGAPTSISGSLLANGRVALVNPAGVYFGPSARVDVSRLLASGMNLSDASFLSGEWEFLGGNGSVVNEGQLNAERIYLVGREVVNHGSLIAPDGLWVVAAGERALLRESEGPVYVEVDGKTVAGLKAAAAGGGTAGTHPIGLGIENTGQMTGGKGGVTLLVGDVYAQAFRNLGTVAAQMTTGEVGTVEVAAASGLADNQGILSARSKSTGGGNVQVHAPEIQHGGRIEVSGGGGQVTLAGATTLVSGVIDASGSGTGQTGGRVEVLGQRVGLLDGARIDVSGASGGGTVLVGGDFQGHGIVPNAQRTFVSSGAAISADAGRQGDGGKVIVWADDWTRYHGSVSARGGSEGGNGGFVEVSGRQNLAFTGQIDVGAALGSAGRILLDPNNTTVVSGTGADDNQISDGFVLFADGPGLDFVLGSDAFTALNGNITVETRIDFTILAGVILSLTNQTGVESVSIRAGNNILINPGVLLQTAGAKILLSAGDAASGSPGAGASLQLVGGSFIDTTAAGGNGDITLQNTGTGGISLDGDIQAGTGTVRLVAANGLVNQVSGVLTAGALGVRAGGAVNLPMPGLNDVGTLAADVSGVGNGFLYRDNTGVTIGSVSAADLFAATSGIITAGGNVDVTATAITLSENVSGAGVNLVAFTGDLDLGGRNVTSTGGMGLQATNSTGQILNATGNIAPGLNQSLSLFSGASLTIGAGGVSGIQNTADVNLTAVSNSGQVTLAGTTWNSLNVTGQTGVVVNAAQTTDNGNLVLSAVTGNLNLNGQNLTSSQSMTLEAVGAGGLIQNATGALSLGVNNLLTLRSGGALTVGSGGASNILNTANVELSASSTGSTLTLASAATWNILTGLSQGDLVVNGPQTTDAGTLSLTSTAGDVNLNNQPLSSALGLLLDVQGSAKSILNAGGQLRVALNNTLDVRQGSSLTIGPGGISNVFNPQDVILSAQSTNGSVTLSEARTWHGLTVTGQTGVVVSAQQTADNQNLVLQANAGNVNLNNSSLTSASGLTLQALGAGSQIQNAGGSIAVGNNAALTLRAGGALTVGAGGVSNILNTPAVMLIADSTDSTVSLVSPLTWESLTVTGRTGVILTSAQATDAALLSLQSAVGNVGLNGSDLTSAAGMDIQALGIGGQITGPGTLRVGLNNLLILRQTAALILGAGGFTTIANTADVNLQAESTGGNVTLNTATTWNGLSVTGNTGVLVNAAQTTDGNLLFLTAETGDVDRAVNALISATDMTLQATGAAGDILGSGGLTVGLNSTLTASQTNTLTFASGGFEGLQNSDKVNLIVTSLNGFVNLPATASTFNSLLATANQDVVLLAAVSTDSGTLTLRSTSQNVNLNGNNLASASDLTLEVTGGAGGILNATGTISLERNRTLTVRQPAALAISPGVAGAFGNLQLTADVNLVAASTGSTLTLSGPAAGTVTWNTLSATSSGDLSLLEAQATDGGDLLLASTAGNVDLNTKGVTSSSDLRLTAGMGILDATGPISTGINASLALSQSSSLTVGAGGVTGIQLPGEVNLFAESTAGSVTFTTATTWNGLRARTGFAAGNIVISAPQSTDGGALVLTANNGNVNLNAQALTSATDMTLEALLVTGSVQNASGALAVGTNRNLTLRQGGPLTVGTGGVSNIQNTSAVNLTADSDIGMVTLNSPATWNGLNVTGQTGIVLAQPQTTVNGLFSLTAASGNLDLGNVALTAGHSLLFTVSSPAGQVVNASGAINIGTDHDLFIQAAGPLVIGAGGISNVQNTAGVNLVVNATLGTSMVTLASAATWNSLDVTASNDVVVQGNQTTDFGPISLVSNSGSVNLGNNALTSARDMSLQAQSFLNTAGTLIAGTNEPLNIISSGPLVIGAGGFSNIASAADVNLAVQTTSVGSLTFNTAATWNNLQATTALAGADILINADQSVDGRGRLVLTANAANIDLNGRSLTAGSELSLQAPAGQILDTTGNLSAGPSGGGELRITQQGSLIIGAGGISNILNTSTTEFQVQSINGAVTFASAATWNALQVTAQANVAFSTSQSTTGGSIALTSQTGNIDLGNVAVTTAAGEAIRLTATAASGQVVNAGGNLTVGAGGEIAITQGGNLVIGSGGVSAIQGASSLSLQAQSTQGTVTLNGATTWGELDVIGQLGVIVNADQSVATDEMELSAPGGSVDLNGFALAAGGGLSLSGIGPGGQILDATGAITVSDGGGLSLQQDAALVIGSGGISAIQNTADISLDATSNNGPVTFNTAATWNSLAASGLTLVVNAAQSTTGTFGPGVLSLTATGGALDLNSNNLTSAGDVTLIAQGPGGQLLDPGGALRAGKNAVMTLRQDSALIVGAGGVSNIQNPADVNLNLEATGGSLTLSDARTWNSLTAVAGNGIVLNAAQATDSAAVSLTATLGDVDLNGNTLSAKTDLTLSAIGLNGRVLDATGALSVGNSGDLMILQDQSLTIGAGGVSNIQNASAVDLTAQSFSGTLDFNSAATWNSLTATAASDLILNTAQATDSGNMTLTSNGGNVDLNGLALNSAGNLTLAANGASGQIADATGSLSAGINATLQVTQTANLTVGTGGITSVQNTAGVNLSASSTGGSVLFGSAFTWNSLNAASQTGVTLAASSSQSTDSGDLSLLATTGSVNLGGNSLSSASTMTLTASLGSIQNLGNLSVGTNSALTLTQDSALVFGSGGIASILNTPDVALVATTNSGSVTFNSATTWSALTVNAQASVLLNALQATQEGAVSLAAGLGNIVGSSGGLTAATDMTLTAASLGGDLINLGTLTLGVNRTLTGRQGSLASFSPTQLASPADVNLVLESTTDLVVLETAATYNSLTLMGGRGVAISAAQTTDSGTLSVTASQRQVDLKSNALTSAAGLTLQSQGADANIPLTNVVVEGGEILNAGNLTLAANNALTIVQTDSLTLGSGGFATIQNPDAVNLTAKTSSGIATLNTATTWNSLDVQGQNALEVHAPQNTDSGLLSLTANTGELRLNGVALTSAGFMTLQALAVGGGPTPPGTIERPGNLTVAANATLTITQGEPLIIGTGGITTIQSPDAVDLIASSLGGTVTASDAATWNSLSLTAFSELRILAAQTTDSGSLTLVSTEGNVEVENNAALSAAQDMTLQATFVDGTGDSRELRGLTGNLAVGTNRTLTLKSAGEMLIGGDGITTIQSPADVNLVLESPGQNGEITFASAATWNSLQATASGSSAEMAVEAAQTTDSGNLIFTTNSLGLKGSALTSAQDMTLSYSEIENATGALNVGTNRALTLTSSEQPIILGPGGITTILNTADVNLSATAAGSAVGVTNATTWNSVTVTAGFVDFGGSQTADGGVLSATATQGSIRAAGVSLTVTGAALTLTASGNVNGGITAGDLAGTAVTASAGSGGSITLASDVNGGGGNVTFSGSDLIATADGLNITNAANVNFNLTGGITVGGGNFTLSATGVATATSPSLTTGITVNSPNALNWSASGGINLSGTSVTADQVTLTANGAGAVITAPASLNVQTLTAAQNGALIFGAGGINPASSAATDLSATSSGSSVTFAQGFTWRSLQATGQTGIVVQGAQSTNNGGITFTANTGNLDLNSNALSSNTSMTLTASGGSITNTGNLSVATDQTLTLSQNGALTIGTGGITGIQNASAVNLVANSTGNAVTFASAATWNSLSSTGQTGLTVNAAQVTDSGALALAATTGNISAGSNGFSAAGALSLLATGSGGDITSGGTTGVGVTLNANDLLSLSTVINGLGGNVVVTAATLNTAGGLDIRNASLVDVNVSGTLTTTGGNLFTIQTGITGTIDLEGTGTVDVQSSGQVSFNTSGAVGIRLGNAQINGGDIFLFTSNAAATIEQGPSGALRVNADGGDIDVFQAPGVTIGAGGILLGGTTGFIDLTADSSAGSVAFASALTLNSIAATGQTGIVLNSGSNLTADSGSIGLTANTGNLDLGANAVNAAMDLTLTATAGSVINASGNLTVGSNRSLNVSQQGGLTIGAGGLSAIQNAAQVVLSAASTAGSVTFADPTTWRTLSATGQTGVTANAAQTTAAGALTLTAVTNAISAGDFASAGALSLTATGGGSTADVIAGSLTGAGVTVQASDTITLSSTIDGQGGSVVLTAASLQATTNGLDIQDASLVDLNISGTATIAFAGFTINNGITGTIDATGTGVIDTAAAIQWQTSGAGGINIGSADLIGVAIFLTTTNATASIQQQPAGSLSLSENNRPISLTQSPSLTIGTGGILLAGTAAFIDLTATSNAGAVTLANAFTLNSLTVTGQTGVVVSGSQTTDGGVIRLTANTGNVNLSNNNLTSTEEMTLAATTGSILNTANLSATPNRDINITQDGNLVFGTGGIAGILAPDTLGVLATSLGGSVTFNTATTWGSLIVNAQTDINVNFDQVTNGAMNLTASTGSINAGSNDLAGVTGLTLQASSPGGSISAGSISGLGVTVIANNAITLSSVIDGGNSTISLNAASLNATTDGLDIRNATLVDMNISGTITVNGGDFTANSGISGALDAANTGAINVQGVNSLLWQTSSPAGIFLGDADLNAGSISLICTDAAGRIQQTSSGSLSVNADGGDIDLSQNPSLILGSGGILLGGNTAFIDVSAASLGGSVTLASPLSLNSLDATGQTGIAVNAAQTTDSGILGLTATTGDVDLNSFALTAGTDMTLRAQHPGGLLLDADGALTVGTSRTLTLSQGPNLTIGSGGISGIQNKAAVNLAASSTAGTLTVNGATTWDSLSLSASGNVVVNASQTADNGALSITSTTGDISAGSNSLAAASNGSLTLLATTAARDISAGSLAGNGILVHAGDVITLATLLDALGGDVTLIGTSLSASSGGLDIRNAGLVDLDVSNTLTVNGGNFSVEVNITGIIDATNTGVISVLGGNILSWSTNGAGGINLGSAAVSAGAVTLQATNGSGRVQQAAGGSLAVTSDNSAVGIFQGANLTLGTGGILLGGTTSFINLNAQSTTGSLTFASPLALNQAQGTAQSGITLNAALATDLGNITLSTSTGNLTIAAAGSISSAGALSLQAQTGDVVNNGSLAVGTDQTLSITQGNNPLVFGSGGLSGIQNSNTVNLEATSLNSTVNFNTAVTWNSLEATGETGVVLTAAQTTDSGQLRLAALTGNVNAGTLALVSAGLLSLEANGIGGDITAGSLTGGGVTLFANDQITLSSVIDGQGGTVSVAGASLNATTNGLDIQDAGLVDLDINGTATINGGNFTVQTLVTGAIDATGTSNINVQGNNTLTWQTSGAGGITYGNANINAASITLTTTNASASIQQTGGSLAVNADGGDIVLSQAPTLQIGAGGILIGGTDAFIDLTAQSTAGSVAFNTMFTFNSLDVTGEVSVTVNAPLATDAGGLRLFSDQSNIFLNSNALASAQDLFLDAACVSGGQIVDAGNLSVGVDRTLSLEQGGALTLGSGGINGILNQPQVNLVVESMQSTVTFNDAATWNSLTGTSAAGVNVNAAQTTDSGVLSLTATAGNISGGNNALTSAGSLTLSASAGSLSAGALNTSTGALTVGSGSVTLGGQVNSNSGAVNITASSLTITATGNNINTSSGNVNLNVSGAVNFTGGMNTSSGVLTVNAGTATLGGGINSTSGPVNVTANSLTISGTGNNINTSSGNVNLNVSGAVNFTGGMNTSSGVLTVNAGTATLGGGINSTSGPVNVTANSLTISGTGNNINTSTSAVTLAIANTLNLAGGINSTSGPISVSGNSLTVNGTINTSSTVSVNATGATGTFTGATLISGGDMTLQAQGIISLNAVNAGGNLSASAASVNGRGVGIDLDSAGRITLTGLLDGQNGPVSASAANLDALTSGLQIRQASLVDLDITGVLTVNGGSFTADTGITGTIDVAGTGSINVQGSNTLAWRTSGSGGITYGNAPINAASITLETTNASARILAGAAGTLSVNADGGDITLIQQPDLVIGGSDGIRFGGTPSFIDLVAQAGASSGSVLLFSAFRPTHVLTLNSLQASGRGVSVNGLPFTDSGNISLTAASGSINAGFNALTAAAALTLTATSGGAAGDVIAGTLTGRGVTVNAGDTIQLARTIDALGSAVNLTGVQLIGVNGLEIRNSNPTFNPASFPGTISVAPGRFIINGVVVNASTQAASAVAAGTTQSATRAVSTAEASSPAGLVIPPAAGNVVATSLGGNPVLVDASARIAMADVIEASPEQFEALRLTNGWLIEAEQFLVSTREVLAASGGDPGLAGEMFLALYCAPLKESHPRTYELLKQMADRI